MRNAVCACANAPVHSDIVVQARLVSALFEHPEFSSRMSTWTWTDTVRAYGQRLESMIRARARNVDRLLEALDPSDVATAVANRRASM